MKLFTHSLKIFLLLFLSVLFLFLTTQVNAATNGKSCKCDHGEDPFGWGSCSISGSPCDSGYPYCISGQCYDQPNDPGGACGEPDDCKSKTCIDKTCTSREPGATCKDSRDCNSAICGQYPGPNYTCGEPITPKNNSGASSGILACSNIHNVDTCNQTSGCFWALTNGKGYCASGTRGNSCGAEIYCPVGYTCNVKTSNCDFVSCFNINNVDTCNQSAGCFWALTNGKGYCAKGARGTSCGATIYCPIGYTCNVKTSNCDFVSCSNINDANTCNEAAGCSWGSDKCNNDSAAGSDQCEGVDNTDKAFKCFSSACGSSTGSYSESTTNSGVYSCSGNSAGTYCCKDPNIYSNRGSLGPQGSSNTGTSPAANTPIPNRSEALPCEFHNGQKNYAGAFCGSADGKTHESFDPSKARNGVFCSMTYIDAYDCNDGTTDYFPVAGNTTCSKSPWCPSKSTVTPSPTDAPGCITQGISCGPGNDCCASKNLVCVDPLKNGFFTCQYNTDPSKGPVGAFTPTPGTSGNCDGANFGHWGAGCACPAGGGCGPGTGCYPEASGAVPDPINNPKGQFCAASRWCAKSQTDVSGAAACATSSTYSSPTPTQKDLGYQADCPNTNVDGSANACVTGSSCPTGYTQHASEGTIGGTNGNQVCTEFEGGIPSVCCTRTAGGTAPVVSSAPTPTPVPFNPSTSKPTGPYIPFTSVGACPAGLEGYWKGTYCDTDKTYYDVYCEGGVPTRHPSGATCQ